MLFMSLGLWLAAFIFPLGIFPFQDFFRDYLMVWCGLLLFSIVYWRSDAKIGYPAFLIFFPLGLLLLSFSYWATQPTVSISYNFYLIAFLTCALISLAITGTAWVKGRNNIIDGFAVFLLFISILSCALGLLRYYGVLKQIIPVITIDGDRFIGTLGQPNLTAILITLGLGAGFYLRARQKLLNHGGFYGIVFFLIYCGTLTGSRSWFIAVSLVLLLWVVSEIKKNAIHPQVVMRLPPWLAVSASIFILAFWVVPVIDQVISKPLIDSGYVNRVSAETMYTKRDISGSSGRVVEWSKILDADLTVSQLWIGHGAGRYGIFSNKVALEKNLRGNGLIWNNAHNIFINFFVEFGLLGLAFISTLYLFIARLVFRSEKSQENIFLISILGVLVFHSLVEFSLWSLPFLGLFVSAISLLDRVRTFTFSGYGIKRVIVLCLVAVFLPLSFYVGRDATIVASIMYKQSPNMDDRFALQDATRSSIIGDKATSVLILKFFPSLSSLNNDLAQVTMLSKWRPSPLVLLRKSSLLVASGERERACESITNTIRLYPDTVVPIQNELDQLSSENGEDYHFYFSCIFRGVDNWVD